MAEEKEKEQTQTLGLTVGKLENFSRWYDEVLEKAGIVDLRYPIKGMPVYMPHGFAILRACFNLLEQLLRKTGHKDALFPLLIPEDVFGKEAEHIKGFKDEVIWATKGGKEELERNLALRPTSETIIYPMFALWIRSYSDLPIKVFQTTTVYRHETKATRPLLRGREVFWNEAHCAHATWEDAEADVRQAVKTYNQFYDALGIPYLVLKRPEWDKFPGAVYSVAWDTQMPDGKVLQIGTAHNLGEKFSKVYDVRFTAKDGSKKLANLTTYGISMRCLASVVSIHGDDKGLVLPSNIAPIHIVIVPVLFKGFEKEILEKCKGIKKRLEEEGRWSIVLDDREDKTAGFKFNEWELKGVPLRIEIGPRDIKAGVATVVRRDSGKKEEVRLDVLNQRIHELLLIMQRDMATKAGKTLQIRDASSMEELTELADSVKGREGGFIRAPFHSIEKDGEKCAEQLQKRTGLHVRGTKFERTEKVKEGAKCIVCGAAAAEVVYLAKPY